MSTEAKAVCLYCDVEVPERDVPPVDDDEAWEELAAEHGDSCEWVRTRAHRIDPESA